MPFRPATRRSLKVYRALLRFYPTEFRQRFGEEMALSFAQQCEADVENCGPFGFMISWIRSLADVVWSASAEWLRLVSGEMRPTRGSIAALVAAISASAFLGYVNLHNDEVQAPLAILLGASFMLGLLRPRRAWLWAAIVALSIPVSSLISLKTGVYYPCRPGHPYSCEPTTLSNAISTVVLLIPALISTYAGAFLSPLRIRA